MTRTREKFYEIDLDEITSPDMVRLVAEQRKKSRHFNCEVMRDIWALRKWSFLLQQDPQNFRRTRFQLIFPMHYSGWSVADICVTAPDIINIFILDTTLDREDFPEILEIILENYPAAKIYYTRLHGVKSSNAGSDIIAFEAACWLSKSHDWYKKLAAVEMDVTEDEMQEIVASSFGTSFLRSAMCDLLQQRACCIPADKLPESFREKFIELPKTPEIERKHLLQALPAKWNPPSPSMSQAGKFKPMAAADRRGDEIEPERSCFGGCFRFCKIL